MQGLRPTEKQTAARQRNFTVMRLRGLRRLIPPMRNDRRRMIEAIIDDELTALGASLQSQKPFNGKGFRQWGR